MLAQDLGYFDQAHLTRDFKQITGVSPGRYLTMHCAFLQASAASSR
jgi:AraC-like DNA-binding protein